MSVDNAIRAMESIIMSGEKIQVRAGWWRQRCGNVVRIVGASNCPDYPWKCAYGAWYRDDGRWSKEQERHPLDLVAYGGGLNTRPPFCWRQQNGHRNEHSEKIGEVSRQGLPDD